MPDKSKKPNKSDKKPDMSKKSDKPVKSKKPVKMSDKPVKSKKQPDLIEYDRFPLMKKPTFVRKDIYTGADIPIFI
jgi:hypothetical protein